MAVRRCQDHLCPGLCLCASGRATNFLACSMAWYCHHPDGSVFLIMPGFACLLTKADSQLTTTFQTFIHVARNVRLVPFAFVHTDPTHWPVSEVGLAENWPLQLAKADLRQTMTKRSFPHLVSSARSGHWRWLCWFASPFFCLWPRCLFRLLKQRALKGPMELTSHITLSTVTMDAAKV